MTTNELIPNLFRTEYSKLVAVLCKVFGLSNIQLAEDIVSETFLLAAETWGKKGIPDNQVGWLYTVAKNKAKDHFRRDKVRRDKIEPNVSHQMSVEENNQKEFEISDQIIEDSQLQMLFATCHPLIPQDAQIALGLRVLCGFGIDEIASSLLITKQTLNKKLYRAKQKLKEHQVEIALPDHTEITERLDAVLLTIYLLFNEGYYASDSINTIRKDLCYESIRLGLLLTHNKLTNIPKVNALVALMLFHASRLEARIDDQGAFILYEDQDAEKWNTDLIQKGEKYMNLAAKGNALSKYHCEAAIAYWHTQKEDQKKWQEILNLYNYLLQLEYSPIAALNRTYALSKIYGKEKAIKEALKLELEKSHLYHMLLADLYSEIDDEKKRIHLKLALQLAKSEQEKYLIKKRLAD